VQRLRRLLSSRRDRREERSFAFEGPTLLAAAIHAGIAVERAFVAADSRSDEVDVAIDLARAAGTPVATLAPGVLEKVADAVTPHGCAAIARERRTSLEELSLDGLLVVLDEVRDPGNLGAVVRVAEAAGCRGVVLTGSPADPFGPKALRGSTGSTFRIPIVEAGPIGPLLDHLAARGVATVATSSHGGEDFARFAWPDAVAIVLGNEAAGLDARALDVCGRRVMIPLVEAVESLNLAVTAGILVFAASRHLAERDAPAKVLR